MLQYEYPNQRLAYLTAESSCSVPTLDSFSRPNGHLLRSVFTLADRYSAMTAGSVAVIESGMPPRDSSQTRLLFHFKRF